MCLIFNYIVRTKLAKSVISRGWDRPQKKLGYKKEWPSERNIQNNFYEHEN